MLESLSNKVTGLKAGNFIKKRLQRRCLPVNIAKFVRTAFFYNTSRGCFCQFDEVTLQYWASVSTKKGSRSGQSMFFTCY